MGGTLLQIFLLVNVFLIGALTAYAIQHAYAHFRPHKPDDNKPQTPTLSAAAKERILKKAETNFQMILDHAAGELQYDLKATSDQLSSRLSRVGVDIVETEMKRYKADLEALREQTDESISGAQNEVIKHQADLDARMATYEKELRDKLAIEIAAEKKQLLDQMDVRLADAVASFLIETLQHNVDLGAQAPYLTSKLEEHKAELKKEIADEA